MSRKTWMTIAAALAAASAQAVLVADFDRGAKPNNLGGDFGAWDKDPSDKTQSAREAFDDTHTRTGQGYCMKITYDVDSPNSSYNGFWMKLGTLDARALTKLVFWARGDDKKGCPGRVKVELKSDNERGAFYVDGITEQWTKFEVPLDEFNISDLASLTEVVIVFEDHSTAPKEGILYLDDVSFE